MTTTTASLTDFLLARIAEDEAAVSDSAGWYEHRFAVPRARMLAECEAKRRIVEELRWRPQSGMECDGHPGSWMPHGDYGHGYCMEPASRDGEEQWVLRHLAAVYADHPDYRDDWRP